MMRARTLIFAMCLGLGACATAGDMEARIAALEARLAAESRQHEKAVESRKLSDKSVAGLGYAGLTRAGPGAFKEPVHVRERRQLQTTSVTSDGTVTNIDETRTTMDHTWILVAGLICFFLQAGFALLEAGTIRAKNAKNIALKNLMDACVGGVVYYLFGYAFAYGSPGDGSGNAYTGGENEKTFMLVDVGMGEFYGFFFQYVFAATIATIVSGAVAERITFSAYMIYSAVLTGVIYPWCSHWIWSGDGFLNKMGIIDYAGGGAVHALSGVAAFMGAAACGPRLGRFDESGKPIAIPPHNVSMMALGTFILWFGFIPFNAGSGVSMLGWMAGQTARIAVMTTLGGCSGGVTSLLWGLYAKGYPSVEYAMNGVLAGMVAVCSPCAVVDIWAVFWVISPLAVLSFWGLMALEEKFQIDDPLGASALHFGPGIVGMIAVGFFGKPIFTENAYGYSYGEYRKYDVTDPDVYKNYVGVFYGGNGVQLGYQIAASLIYTAYGAITCAALFYSMKYLGILRVSEEDEMSGLDKSHHGGPAYVAEGFGSTDGTTTKNGTYKTDVQMGAMSSA